MTPHPQAWMMLMVSGMLLGPVLLSPRVATVCGAAPDDVAFLQRGASVPVDDERAVDALVEQFRNERVFWRQFTIAKAIVDRRDIRVIPQLEPWLDHEDRHIRGNVAFIVASLGDPRGFPVIAAILTDRSARPEGQGIAIVPSDGKYRVSAQIAADRYYAAHLLGDLRDPRAVPILTPLQKDPEVGAIVPWALGQIRDER